MVAHASILAINLRLAKLPYWLISIVLLSPDSDFDNRSPNGSDFDSWSSMSNVDMSPKYQVCFWSSVRTLPDMNMPKYYTSWDSKC